MSTIRSRFVRWGILSVALVAATMFAALPARAQNKPNIVYILVDNIGWGDFGVYGGTTPTPRIDALAKEGMRFTNYNVENQCTPTRSAIMTGRYPIRSGTMRIPLPGQGAGGLSPWEYTIAKLLSDAGYATALYGKWHLGDVEGRLPNNQGFDEWWGIKNSWDEAGYTSYPAYNEFLKQTGGQPPQVWTGRKGEPSKPVMPLNLQTRPTMAEKVTDLTIKYIQKASTAGKPFFVYVGYPEMHPPIMPNPAFRSKSLSPEALNAIDTGNAFRLDEKTRQVIYADMLREMDYRVGLILDAIKKAGVDDNTIVILASDNGTGGAKALLAGSSGPYRGNFFTPAFEGSIRTAAMIRWPGKIKAGVVTDQMLAAVDWLPTLADFAGASKRVPTDRPIDGIDASKFMLGQSPSSGRDSLLCFNENSELMGLKWHNYKAVFWFADGVNAAWQKARIPFFFDLSQDPGEKDNLFDVRLDNGWLLEPLLPLIMKYEISAKEYPNIKPGEKFNGYSKVGTWTRKEIIEIAVERMHHAGG